MVKKITTLFFSVIFLLYLSVPAIMVLVDNTPETSVVISNSEEQDKGIELVFLNTLVNEANLVYNSTKNNLVYHQKNYPNPYLNFISQPPEHLF